MKDNDFLPTRFTSMLMSHKVKGSEICVEYSPKTGFCTYVPGEAPQRPAKDDIWEVYLEVPLRHQQFEVFQSRLAHFTSQGRETSEICDFLHKELLEFLGHNLAVGDDQSHLKDWSDWEIHLCNCCNDLDAWLRDRDFELVWDDWEDCLYTVGLEWWVGSMQFADIGSSMPSDGHDGHCGITACRTWRSLVPFKEPLQRTASKRPC
ncbi:hypothetical protein [Geomonas anaerohicana]|uniref:Uncharacterized protein n=1 Tax=Geomonas anaerohicana TaxID=2798583 RepID=A0ABS0YC37_9BACT|nr:hypothetical protein [Geomonas anaerohicana]MBJ6749861.1 hypothetical protein [Geomonas anaerohicana]